MSFNHKEDNSPEFGSNPEQLLFFDSEAINRCGNLMNSQTLMKTSSTIDLILVFYG